MSSNDTETVAELARLCTEARSKLPAEGFHRLRVLLDMVLLDLAREGEARSIKPEQAGETASASPPRRRGSE